MSVIYEPRGRAKEYSPYALNLYLGCTHRCRYCYAPHALQRTADNYFAKPAPRRDVLKYLEKDLSQNQYDKQILLSFIGDIYCETSDDNQTTSEALRLLNAFHAPVAVLSKGGSRILRDMDVFRTFGDRIAVGATLTFYDECKSREWEPGAALPTDRLETLKILHDSGIKTFVSFEPVVEPEESLTLIEQTLLDNSVDHYKIGKLNNYRGLDKGVDWREFLIRALKLLRPAKKQVYIKESLRAAAPDVPLYENETDPERYIVKA